MKVFVSLPMRFSSDDDIRKAMQHAVDYVRHVTGCDAELVDSFFECAPHEAKPLWFIAKSIELMSTADLVCFYPGWDKARGCKIEHACAVAYGIPTIYCDEFDFGICDPQGAKGVIDRCRHVN